MANIQPKPFLYHSVFQTFICSPLLVSFHLMSLHFLFPILKIIQAKVYITDADASASALSSPA